MDFLISLGGTAFAPWQAILGFFSKCIEWMFDFTMLLNIPSYILAIFFFTIIIRLVTQPLQNKQLRSTRKIQLLKPEVEAIKKRHPNDPQKQQKLTMDLYKEHGASPMAGCLPMLIQMPILIALFSALRQFGVDEASLHPFHPEYFSFWIWDNLAMLVSETPGIARFLLPVLAGGTTLLQQFATSSDIRDRQQRMMLIVMPLMFMFIVNSVPVLLAFYWIFYNLIGAAIVFPILRRWKKIDQAAIEAMRAEKEAEEAERRAKREAARERNRKKGKNQQYKRPNYAVKAGDQNVSQEEEAEAVVEYVSPEQIDLSYIEGMEGQELEEALNSEEVEIKFKAYLKEKKYIVKKKKLKLHPYDTEAVEVKLILDDRGRETDYAEMRKRFVDEQIGATSAAPTNMSVGEMFGLGRKKKKNNKQENAADKKKAPAKEATPLVEEAAKEEDASTPEAATFKEKATGAIEDAVSEIEIAQAELEAAEAELSADIAAEAEQEASSPEQAASTEDAIQALEEAKRAYEEARQALEEAKLASQTEDK